MTALMIRKMTNSDLDQVMEIERTCFPLPWSRSSFEREIRFNTYACYIVAGTEKNGDITGYAGSWVIFEDAHITTLAVHPQYRRTGAGSTLFASLLEMVYARGARQVLLEVRVSNEAARNLYEKFGFKITGVRKNYYLNEDALVMAAQHHHPEEFKGSR